MCPEAGLGPAPAAPTRASQKLKRRGSGPPRFGILSWEKGTRRAGWVARGWELGGRRAGWVARGGKCSAGWVVRVNKYIYIYIYIW